MKDKRQFIIWDRRDGKQPAPSMFKNNAKPAGLPRQDEEGLFISDGILGKISRNNVYLTAYPNLDNAVWPEGCNSLDDLQIGQRVENVEYSLSGSSGVYDIYRIQDAPPERRLKHTFRCEDVSEIVTGDLTLSQTLIDMAFADTACPDWLLDVETDSEVELGDGGAIVRIYTIA